MLLINPKILRVLGKDMWGVSCVCCDRRQSKWDLQKTVSPSGGAGEFSPVCSLCLLYRTPWAEQRVQEIDFFLKEVEVQRQGAFERDSQGHLLHCEDADRIMGTVFLWSVTRAAREAMRRRA